MSLSRDVKHVVVSDASGGFSLHSLKTGELVRQFDIDVQRRYDIVLPSSFIHEGRVLMTPSVDGSVYLWDVEDGYIFGSLEHGREGWLAPVSLCFLSNRLPVIIRCFSVNVSLAVILGNSS